VKEPLYSVIANRAETRIRSGEWAEGTRLPPERDLCRELDVSRSTLRQALAELEQRELITRHQGRGTFVARPRVPTPLSGFFSISEALRARGVAVTTRVVGVATVEASRQLAEDLAILPGDPVVQVERLRIVDGEPLVLESSSLPAHLVPGISDRDLAGRSLYDVLREDYGLRVTDTTETLEPVILTPRESALLAVPRHAPAILTRRITTDADGQVIELAQGLLRGDRSRFLLRRRLADPTVPVTDRTTRPDGTDRAALPAADGPAADQPAPAPGRRAAGARLEAIAVAEVIGAPASTTARRHRRRTRP
jgi:GntR family transcriptional regulator